MKRKKGEVLMREEKKGFSEGREPEGTETQKQKTPCCK